MKRIFFSVILISLFKTNSVCVETTRFKHKEPIQQMEYENIYKRIISVDSEIKRMFVNVKDYGAKGDSSTDDTSAIQAAFNNSTSSSVVYFPAGTYMYSSAIVWPNRDNVTVYGYGATLKLMDSKNTDLMQSFNYPSSGGGQRPRILGITIDGTSATNTLNGSVVFYGIHGGIMQDVTVQNNDGVGFFLVACSSWTFNSCYAYNSGASGFCAYNDSHNIEWNSCHAFRCAPGFLLQGPEVNGQLKSTGLRINGGSSVESTTNQDNIQVFSGVDDFVINGVYSSSATGRGLNIYSSTTTALNSTNVKPNRNGIVSNCIFTHNAVEGVKVWDDGFGTGRGANNIIFSGNRIGDQSTITQPNGLVIQSSANYITAIGNDVCGNVTNNLLVGAGVNVNGNVTSNTCDSGAYFQTKFLTMVNNSTTTVANSNTPIAFATIVTDQGYAAGVSIRGGFNSTLIGFDATSQFSTVSGTANKTNVYYNGGTARYEIENQTGGTRTYSIFYYKQ